MNPTSNDVFTAALALPEGQRLDLAWRLMASVKPPGMLSEDDPGFAAEILRRCEAIDSGEMETVDADEAMRMLRARHEARNKA